MKERKKAKQRKREIIKDQKLFRVTKDRKLWRTMIMCILNGLVQKWRKESIRSKKKDKQEREKKKKAEQRQMVIIIFSISLQGNI